MTLPGVSAADDGRPDLALRTALSAWRSRPGRRAAALVSVALVDARVFVPVVAAATGLRDGPHGLRAEEGAEMSLVTLVGVSGATAVAAFTDAAAMAAWRSDVRPVAVPGPVAGATAVSEGHAALVLDVAGPAFVVDGIALDALARGEVPAGAGAARAADPATLEVVRPPGDRAVLERLAEAVAPALPGEAWLVGLRSTAQVDRADGDAPADGPTGAGGPTDAARDAPAGLALGLAGAAQPGRLEVVGAAVAARLPRDAPPLDLVPLQGHLLAQARRHGIAVDPVDPVDGGPGTISSRGS